MSDKSQPADELPPTIGRYQITGNLGFGAMGAVYLAFDPLIKRTLAIKTVRLDLPRQSPQHRAFIERFYQEARISGTLSHPNIVTLFDIGEENGIPFLAMEYVDGQTIAALLDEGTSFKPEKVLGLVSQVASALDYAHSRGVIHRDIKPANLIVFEGEKVKVTDFGIAKLIDSEITHSGTLLGTPSYMSPEQAMGEKLDGRSDIFSLGVCAFEMLSGEQPFPGANVTSILYKLVNVEPIEPANLEMNGLVPQKWREVFHKVLAKKPDNRYQTACAFVEDLEYCLGSWFTGLGEETVTVPTTEAAETTVTLPSVPSPAFEPLPAVDSAAPVSEAATVMLSAAPEPTLVSGPEADDSDTLVVVSPEVDLPQTVITPAGGAPEDLAQARTFLLAPPHPAGASSTQPLPPTLPALPGLPPPTRAPRRGVPGTWLLGAAAAVFLVAASLVGWTLWQRSLRASPAPEPSPVAEAVASALPAAPPSLRGSLRVESEPSGARVVVNGSARGETPLVLGELPFGSYQVRLELKGFETQTQEVALGAGSPDAQLRANLTRSVAGTTAPTATTGSTGTADVASTPPGAEVAIDGQAVGKTPLAGLRLKPGRHRVQVEIEDHETWTGTVDVMAGARARVEAKLRPAPKPNAPPTPEPVDTSRAYENRTGDVDVLARKISGVSPSYPSGAPRLKSGERVSVLVMFVVTEAGEVQDVTVQESGGKLLDEVVAAAIRSWRFQPATKRGTPVKVRMPFKQTFLGG